MTDSTLILVAVGGIVLLIWLVVQAKLQAYVALLLVSLMVGVAAGMPLQKVLDSIKNGMGGTLGFVAVVVGLGAMFGQLLEACGGIERLAQTLLSKFGEGRSQWALTITGFIVAIPVFFDVGFVILVPLVYGLARKTGRSLVYYGIPLLAGLVVTHSFVPPTPGPIAVAELLQAELGWVILFGALAGIPATIIAGPLFAKYLATKIHAPVPEYFEVKARHAAGEAPGFSMVAGIILLPLALILLSTMASALLPSGAIARELLAFVGHPFVALLLATLLAFYFLGIKQGFSKDEIQELTTKALEPAGIIILVTGAGGVFKQVLIDSGVGEVLAELMASSSWPPIVLAFVIAAFVRIIQGSATVAMITAAGILAPVISTLNLHGPILGLLVIAIAAGATILSHVNDSGFWLVNRYFGLSEKDTLRSWTMMATLVAIVGFAVVVVISFFI